ncbi:tyrosine-type recombinase/integrase [Candidatus Ruthturnera calyptogenae]|uniref:tyrosine-type recombinase/integrase n=1 Tax=Candidatus Ruthturnera calyptogenae TaxID=386487 RepID=UPI0004640EA8|nr:tyrosine-type recombinase/integrase [Candidatus Ruthturnera calyptogenae]
MIVRTVQNMVKKRALEVGIKVNMYLHMLRHAMIIHFLQSSHDLRSTQEFLEYSSIKSTKVYGQCYPKVKKS